MSAKKKKNAARDMWKMSPERLQAHLMLRTRARTIPDKKKQQSKQACRRGKWQASGLVGVPSLELFPMGRRVLCAGGGREARAVGRADARRYKNSLSAGGA